MKFDAQTFRLTEASGAGNRTLIVGILVTVLSCLGYFIDSPQFYFSYLVAWLFWVSIGLGGLFFVMLNHLTGATWGMVLRRISETVMITLPYMVIFFIPVIFGIHDLYHWSHAEEVAKDAILSQKTGYLNVPFFIIRTIFYFAVWYLLARLLYKTSIKQDENPDGTEIHKMRKISAPGMVVFALTISFAAFDWLMSLDAHWYSTIFGLYFFAGGLLGVLTGLVVFGLWIRRKGILSDTITVEHYHDLAKLIFSFTIFWGYMAFSQYFLIWYANIPEETIYFRHRWEGTWKIFTMALVFGHFVVPFVGLMTRAAKRNMKWLVSMSIWILLMHWIDIYWMAVPVLHHHGIHIVWMDITLFLGIGAVFMGIFWKYFSSKALIPVNDVGLSESVKFSNN